LHYSTCLSSIFFFLYLFTIQPTFLPYFTYLFIIFFCIFQIFSLFILLFFRNFHRCLP
jgi:hypothetical protein